MKTLELNRMLLDGMPADFLVEVGLRVLFAYLLVFLFLKFSGRRGVRQLSLFELVVILMLGSAAGDVAFYEDVPLLPVAGVFVFLLLLYRSTLWAMDRIPRLGLWIEGGPVTIIRDGHYDIRALRQQNISCDEFFMELRQLGAEHLGQIRLGILEVDGDLSVYFYADEEVRPGLSVLPDEFKPCYRTVPRGGIYACSQCGATQTMLKDQQHVCQCCENRQWTLALDSIRCR